MNREVDPLEIACQQLRSKLEEYLVDVPAPCPYGLQKEALYRQVRIHATPEPLLDILLALGYRRNGNIYYAMACPDCCDCIPIRLRGDTFQPSRSQKRVLARNRDVTVQIGPVSMCSENIALCRSFLANRYPAHQSRAEDYYSGFFAGTANCTFEFRYRVDNRLVAVAIVDVGKAALNAVYCYYDPAEAQRSPGAYNILHLIRFCREKDLDYLYLGYWIPQVRAMKYKSNYRPHELLQEGLWVETGD
jgi:arginine-tRNA-protein transferase